MQPFNKEIAPSPDNGWKRASQGGKSTLLLLCLVHLVNDAYLSVIPFVLPALLADGRIDFGRGTVLAGAFLFTATALQPFIGGAAGGRWGRWSFLASVGWAGLFLAVLAAASLSFPALAIVAALAGLGVAAFHPLASAHVFRSAPPESRGRWMAVFLAAGNLGWSLPPLIVPGLLQAHGLTGLAWAVVAPGLLASTVLWVAFRRPPEQWSAPRAGTHAGDMADQRGRWPLPMAALPAVGIIVTIVALRSWANFGFVTALPVHLHEMGLDSGTAGRWVALFAAAGVAGGLAGGTLSDRFGRRRVTVVSLATAAVCFALFLVSPGAGTPTWLILGGGALLTSFPATLVAAQERLPGNPALAGGLLLGFAVGLGSLGVMAMGTIAEAWGRHTALWALAAAPLVAAGLAARMPEKRIMPVVQPAS